MSRYSAATRTAPTRTAVCPRSACRSARRWLWAAGSWTAIPAAATTAAAATRAIPATPVTARPTVAAILRAAAIIPVLPAGLRLLHSHQGTGSSHHRRSLRAVQEDQVPHRFFLPAQRIGDQSGEVLRLRPVTGRIPTNIHTHHHWKTGARKGLPFPGTQGGQAWQR